MKCDVKEIVAITTLGICLLGLARIKADCRTACPHHCVCVNVSATIHCKVECKRKNVPSEFPATTSIIYLRGLILYSVCSKPFNKLRSLKHLTFENSKISKLENTSFDGLGRLRSLELIHCQLSHIEAAAFKPLRKLENLTLNYNPLLGFKSVGDAFYGLQHGGIKILNLKRINDRRVHSGLLYGQEFFYFLNQTRIKVINLQKNQVAICTPGFVKYIKGVEELRFSYNVLIGESRMYYELFTLQHLKLLDLRDQNTINVPNLPPQTSLARKTNDLGKSKHFLRNKCWQFPPHLETLLFGSMKSLLIDDTGWTICPNNSLRDLDISNINAANLSSIKGLNKLVFLDMQNNNCWNVSHKFFKYLPQLETALLGGNKLGSYFDDDTSGCLFSESPHIRHLDISKNTVRQLPLSLVNSLFNLTVFKADNNLIKNIDTTAFFRSPLFISVSRNDISTISTPTLNAFNAFGEDFMLDISENPITLSSTCCDNKITVDWVQSTRIRLHQRDTFTCFHKSRRMNMSTFNYRNECEYSLPALSIIPATVISVCFIISLGSLCYRKRLSLAWFVIILRRHTRSRSVKQYHSLQKVYDAFVAYSEKKVLWVRRHLIHELEEKRGYRLCIHHRNFIPGYPIDQNIEDCIQQSRRTILILTSGFQQSDWCDFETKLAVRHYQQENDCSVIPVLFN